MRYKLGKVTKKAINYVKKNAFNDVLTAFQVLNGEKIPLEFYRYDKDYLFLEDTTYKLLSGKDKDILLLEIGPRWSLIEAAFLMKKENVSRLNNIREIYLEKGYKRTDITNTIPVLNGYQKGCCFYCGESLVSHEIHFDHVIPRMLFYHDEIWNLELAHNF